MNRIQLAPGKFY